MSITKADYTSDIFTTMGNQMERLANHKYLKFNTARQRSKDDSDITGEIGQETLKIFESEKLLASHMGKKRKTQDMLDERIHKSDEELFIQKPKRRPSLQMLRRSKTVQSDLTSKRKRKRSDWEMELANIFQNMRVRSEIIDDDDNDGDEKQRTVVKSKSASRKTSRVADAETENQKCRRASSGKSVKMVVEIHGGNDIANEEFTKAILRQQRLKQFGLS